MSVSTKSGFSGSFSGDQRLTDVESPSPALGEMPLRLFRPSTVGMGQCFTASGSAGEFRLSFVAPLKSRAIGVGQANDEDSASPVGRANIDGSHSERTGSVASSLEKETHVRQPTRRPACNVFDDHGAWSQGSNRPLVSEDESTAFACDSNACTGPAEILAWRPTTEDVDTWKGKQICRLDIAHAPICVRPVFGEDCPAKTVLLDLPNDTAEPRGFEPIFEAPHSGEEASDGQHENSK